MSFPDAPPDTPKQPPAHPVRIFLVANFLYLWLVHTWGLWVPPLDVDFTRMGELINARPSLPQGWVNLMLEVFENWYTGYRIVNLLLLYGCMVGVFFITKAVVKGPWWLGSLAAVLMMANPLKTEATLALTGALHLLPATLAIAGTAFAVWPFARSKAAFECLGAVLICIAMRNSPVYLLAPFVVVCLQTYSTDFKPASLVFWLALGLAGIYLGRSGLIFAPTDALLSLFMVVYPIGLLLSTAAALNASPWLSIAAAALILATWLGLWRATHHPAVFACGLAALLLRICMPPLDLVTMQGGETMLLPIALIAIGFAAVCHSILQHPAWPRHVVLLTTLLCLVFFGLQISAIRVHAAPSSPAPAVAVVEAQP